MSLLSGIKFIPKEKREPVIERKSRSDSDDDENEEVRHKRKKHKKEDKKHSRHRKEHKDKRSSKKEKSYALSDHSSDSEFDMDAIAREEEERERSEWKTMKSVKDNQTSWMYDDKHGSRLKEDYRSDLKSREEHTRRDHNASREDRRDDHHRSSSTTATAAAPAFDPSRFKSLINSLKSASSNDLASKASIESSMDVVTTSTTATTTQQQIGKHASDFNLYADLSDSENEDEDGGRNGDRSRAETGDEKFEDQWGKPSGIKTKNYASSGGRDGVGNKHNKRHRDDDDNYASKQASTASAATTKPVEVVVAPEPVPCKKSNKSAAEMLRERLKGSKGALKSNEMAQKEKEETSGADLFDYYTSGNNKASHKQLLALKSQLNSRNASNASLADAAGTTATATGVAAISAGAGGGFAQPRGRYSSLRDADDDDDMDAIFRNNVLRLGEKYKGDELGGRGVFGNGDRAGIDEEADIDMSLFTNKTKKTAPGAGPTEAELKKQVARVLADKQKMNSIMSHCLYCQMHNQATGNNATAGAIKPVVSGDFVLSKGDYIMLCLKPFFNTISASGGTGGGGRSGGGNQKDVNAHLALAEYHLQLVPIQHVSSILHCDEEAHKEIERYKQCISHMFQRETFTNPEDILSTGAAGTAGGGSSGLKRPSVLFCESAVHFERHSHAVIDVIPVERGVEAEANMFFKEAFLACDEEWSQYRKVVELTKERPLTRAVPSHFQYLMVEWLASADGHGDRQEEDVYGGLVHVVENAENMTTAFCLDVIAGLLDVEPLKMRSREAHPKGMEGNKIYLSEIKDKWSTYDWTQYV